MNPLKPSKYILKKYNKELSEPTGFWTSEDGDLVSIAVIPSGDAVEKIKRTYEHIDIDWEKCKFYNAYVMRWWAGREFFNGYCGQNHGTVWQIIKENTGMPVVVCDLYPDTKNIERSKNET